jgi:hypothetical protein
VLFLKVARLGREWRPERKKGKKLFLWKFLLDAKFISMAGGKVPL